MTTTRAQQRREFIKTTPSKKYEKKTNEMWSPPLKSLARDPRSLGCTLSNAFWGPGNRRGSGVGVEIVVVLWVSREDDRRRTYYMLLCVRVKRRRRRKSEEKKEKEREDDDLDRSLLVLVLLLRVTLKHSLFIINRAKSRGIY